MSHKVHEKTDLEPPMNSPEISLYVLRAARLNKRREAGKGLNLGGQGVEEGS